MAFIHRLRRRLASEEGSFLIEALVTAAILLTVSAGVVLALQTAHAQGGLQRAKALATDVAQTKLDELRSRAYNDLRPLNETTTVSEGGMTFNVVSTATPVSQTGSPSGCDTQRARDYMSLKTTVTWPKMGAREPVVLDTLVASPVGAGGGLLVGVTGGAGQPVPGIPLQLSSGGGQATTDASGCARWDSVAAGTAYGLTASVPGYVRPDGDPAIALSGIAVVAEETAQVNLAYDRGGSVDVTFQQRVSGSTTATALTAPASLPPKASFSNGSGTVVKDVAAGTGATGTAGLLYPFPSSYGVYADTCPAARPPATAPAGAQPSALVPAGGTVATTLELPSLNIKALMNGTILPTAADGVRVRVRTSCGTVVTGRTVKSTDGTLTDPGLPYGTGFTVCAANASNTLRDVLNNVSNTTYAAPGSGAQLLRLTSGGQTCPF